jgi:hypothetical protein
MADLDYDRYSILKKSDGTYLRMPFVKLPENSSDKYINWKFNFDRLDKISQKYYGSPFYDFLIMIGNPTFENEFDIPDNELIRIPFPLKQAKANYEAILSEYVLENS